jgi:sugar lactone lactonase YvrE/serine/threonine protein kinase
VEAAMTDGPQVPGWWQAADLKWYPPEQRPDPAVLPPPPAASATPAPEQLREPAKARQVIGRDKLGVLSKIGQGGQGVVYRAPNVTTKFASSMVYKEYKTQTRADIDFTALAAMPALVEDSLSYSQAERLISIAAWPCAIVDDAGAPSGFVMPAIPGEFFIPLNTAKGVSASTAEFQHLLNHPTVLAARGITVVDAQRFSLLRETASALAFLHKHGVCVGDISPKNLLFSLTPREAAYFIDCDAMRINGVSALPQVQTPGWNAPAGEELATIYSDTYKLGLLALRLLAGDQDTKNPGHLPSTTPSQLRQIITDTLTNEPHRRPLPEAWTYVLGNAIEEAQHQQKTPAPVGAPLAAPEIPVVHSRPSADSAPPVRPSAPPVPPPRPAERPRTEIATPPSDQRPRWQVKVGRMIAAIVVIGALIDLAVVITSQQHKNSNGLQITLPTSTQHREPTYGPQVTLPFTGLNYPHSVAVDAAGAVYVTDYANNRVVELAAGGSATPTVLSFTDLYRPTGVAVDTVGDLYVVDSGHNRVVELAAGSSTQSVLPFTGLEAPTGVAVDSVGDVYVADQNNSRVLKLAAGSSTPSVLPFTGLVQTPGVAVDSAGNVYVTDGANRVLKLAAGSSTPSVLPFGLNNLHINPFGVAVDSAGDLYVTDYGNQRVQKLAAGSSTPTVLPFNNIGVSEGVAVDAAGNVYVAEWGNNRVVKLLAG